MIAIDELKKERTKKAVLRGYPEECIKCRATGWKKEEHPYIGPDYVTDTWVWEERCSERCPVLESRGKVVPPRQISITTDEAGHTSVSVDDYVSDIDKSKLRDPVYKLYWSLNDIGLPIEHLKGDRRMEVIDRIVEFLDKEISKAVIE